ncbi:MAG: hypothetical protein LIO74_04025 [Ruminococcus sp.]|nr:hypothetical protein [Ruminococcus sp.]
MLRMLEDGGFVLFSIGLTCVVLSTVLTFQLQFTTITIVCIAIWLAVVLIACKEMFLGIGNYFYCAAEMSKFAYVIYWIFTTIEVIVIIPLLASGTGILLYIAGIIDGIV